MQLVFYFDQTRCIGCNTCTVACKDWNDVNPGPAFWRRLEVTETGIFPAAVVHNMLFSCFHCKNPACVEACTAGALEKRPTDGIVVADRTRCTGDRKCLNVCPFLAPQFGDCQSEPVRERDWMIDHPMQKCNFCLDRIGDGKGPACVDACLMRALDAGPEEQMLKRHPEAAKTAPGFPDLANQMDTQPGIIFKPKVLE